MIIISEKYRRKLRSEREHRRAIRDYIEYILRKHFPIIYLIRKLIKSSKPPEAYRRNTYSKRKRQKYIVAKEE